MQAMSSEDINKAIGRNIRRIRWASKRLSTLVSLSAQLKLSWQQFQKYETGKNRISLVTAVETAKVLGVPIEAFCVDLGLPEKPVFALSSLEEELISNYRNLHPVAQQRVLTCLADLAHLRKSPHAA